MHANAVVPPSTLLRALLADRAEAGGRLVSHARASDLTRRFPPHDARDGAGTRLLRHVPQLSRYGPGPYLRYGTSFLRLIWELCRRVPDVPDALGCDLLRGAVRPCARVES